jgi:DNA replicative helicase MCM subunit Mcm2 (Cdc46/Mcm family)
MGDMAISSAVSTAWVFSAYEPSFIRNIDIFAFNISYPIRKKIIPIYEKLRDLERQDDVVVGIRQLEALVRLSTAYAKLTLRDTVDDVCVDSIKAMLDDAYTRINPDFGSSGYQAQLQGVPHKLSKEQSAFKIWEECEDSSGHVNLVKFFREMEKAEFDQRDSRRIFSQWETNCVIKLNDDGTYMRSRS